MVNEMRETITYPCGLCREFEVASKGQACGRCAAVDWLNNRQGARAITAHCVNGAEIEVLEGTLSQAWAVGKQPCFGFSATNHTWPGFDRATVRPGSREIRFTTGVGAGGKATFTLKLPEAGWEEMQDLRLLVASIPK